MLSCPDRVDLMPECRDGSASSQEAYHVPHTFADDECNGGPDNAYEGFAVRAFGNLEVEEEDR